MNPEENLAAAYIRYFVSKSTEDFWAFEDIDQLTKNDPKAAWSLTKLMIATAPSDEAIAYIAAGPLEDLLKRNGPKVIDEIEHSTREDEDLQFAMCCVWIDQKFPVCSRVHELIREFGPRLKARLA